MTTYLFPGQGSQSKGMGGSLFSEFPDLVKKADQILGYSIESLCLNDPYDQLNKTEYTQPALYVVNALTYLKKINDSGKKPDYVAGHSLGEYNALFAAEVFDFEMGLRLVQKRGELMSHAKGGKMAASVGLSPTQVQDILQKNVLSNISIANYNSNTQVVISGPHDEILNAQTLFEKAGAMLFLPLKVSGAFHSNYMTTAQHHFTDWLGGFTFNAPKISVIANVTAEPYAPNDISSYLSRQITHSVLWSQTIEYLLKQGETSFEEIGPGTVLMGLVRRIQKGQ